MKFKTLLLSGLLILSLNSFATPPKDVLFYGDSIAHGYRINEQARGATRVGASPLYVYRRLRGNIHNINQHRHVILSTGLSNNPSDFNNVENQFKLLKSTGAKVTVLGVSTTYNKYGYTGTSLNNRLRNLCNTYGFKFNGGFEAGRDRVHPKNYNNLNY